MQNVRAETTFSLITELVHRDGLRSALSGRDDVMLQPILRLLSQYVADPTFGELACDVALLVIGKSSNFDSEAARSSQFFRDVLVGIGPVTLSRLAPFSTTNKSWRGINFPA